MGYLSFFSLELYVLSRRVKSTAINSISYKQSLMSTFYLILGVILLLSSIALIVLLGDLPNYRGTILHKLNQLLVDRVAHKITLQFTTLDKRFFNGYLSSDESLRRLGWIAGWIIPVFYLAVFSRCLAFFFQYTYPQILKLSSEVNWTLRYWIFILPPILLNYGSFFLAVLSDPGYMLESIDKEHVNISKIQSEFPYDDLIFFKVDCSTCKFVKPARSKHCSNCDKCVLMFDHHCIWLNNDVAYYSYRWFLLFLFSTCFIFLYGGYLSYYSLKLEIQISKDIPKTITAAPLLLKYWRLIKNTTFANEISGILLLLCMFLFPAVSFFLGETLWSVYLGVTTNETAKWDYINLLVQNEMLYEFIPRNGDANVFLILNTRLPNGTIQFIKLEDRKPFNNDTGGHLRRIKNWDDMNNVYDMGFWKNLHQRLFPKKLF